MKDVVNNVNGNAHVATGEVGSDSYNRNCHRNAHSPNGSHTGPAGIHRSLTLHIHN